MKMPQTPIRIALNWFSRKFQELVGDLPQGIQAELEKETSPQKAVDGAFKKQGIFGKLRQRVTEVIEKAAEIGLGKKPPKMPELFEAWDPRGMNLSEKLHGTDKEMRRAIVETIKEQLKLGRGAQKAALALYDGYNTGKHVIRKQELPLYLKDILALARRGELTDADKKALQRLIRRGEAQTAQMGQNGAPNKALKTAYNELLEAVNKGSEKAIERGIRLAVEEKSRYVAERIARTEAARAWADAFHARYKDDEEVVAYKWHMGSRHPHFDICDMYADANLYGLGASVFPKDKCPVLPVHPHCLCHLSPVYKGEIDPTEEKDRVQEGCNEWLATLTHGERCKVLGIDGAKAWERGQGDWRQNMRGYSPEFLGTRLTDTAERGRIEPKGGATVGVVEQAKKRDHKIFITDVAIEKVPYVHVQGLSEEICEAIQKEHKAILRMAKNENNSNEILSLMSKNLSEEPVRVPGSEFGADPNTDPKAVSLFNRSRRQEIIYLHNHPSTNKFSLADIMTFIQYGEIGTLSVVTNQGEAHVLNKLQTYDFKKTSQLFDEIYQNYQAGKLEHTSAVKKFLKICNEGGIIYAKSN